MKLPQHRCLNCEENIEEFSSYCSNCGQKTKEDLTLSLLFYNTISNYFSFDARLLKSILPLLFRPGFLAKQFTGGKRKTYIHPAQLYIFISIVFFFLSSFTIAQWEKDVDALNKKIVTSTDMNTTTANIDKAVDSIIKQQNQKKIQTDDTSDIDAAIADLNLQLKKYKIDSLLAINASDKVIYKHMGMSDNASDIEYAFYKGLLNLAKGNGAANMLRSAFDAVPLVMFILLPLFAFILLLFYFKKGHYAHHLVVTFYFFAFLFMLFTLLMLFSRFIMPLPIWFTSITALYTLVYFYFTLKNGYSSHWFWTLIKSIIITTIFSFCIVITTFSLALFGFLNS